MREQTGITILEGEILTKVEQKGDDELVFTCKSGAVFLMTHLSDCCEHVWLEDICGDLEDLCGSPIVYVNEVVHELEDDQDSWESASWTFYNIATIKGVVNLRWIGESNGCYSETVEFYQTKEAEPEYTDEQLVEMAKVKLEKDRADYLNKLHARAERFVFENNPVDTWNGKRLPSSHMAAPNILSEASHIRDEYTEHARNYEEDAFAAEQWAIDKYMAGVRDAWNDQWYNSLRDGGMSREEAMEILERRFQQLLNNKE